jgi:hypothetical protein
LLCDQLNNMIGDKGKYRVYEWIVVCLSLFTIESVRAWICWTFISFELCGKPMLWHACIKTSVGWTGFVPRL